MIKVIKIFVFLILLILIFSKQIISYTLLYSFSKWVDREVIVDNFQINYSKNLIIIDKAEIINSGQFYYKSVFEAGKITLNYSLNSLFTNLIIIKTLKIENPKFFLEIIEEPPTELSFDKVQELYSDNIGVVKKIVKTYPPKIWPKKKQDTNFIVLNFQINGAKVFVKTFLLQSSHEIDLYNMYFSKVGNDHNYYNQHYKDALKMILFNAIARVSDIKLRKLLKKIYNYQ